MFRSFILSEALLLLATPEERAEIELLPRPAPLDVAAIFYWSRSRRHELKVQFLARAKVPLIGGTWNAVGFLAHDPEIPTKIHPIMWHSLELRGLDNDVANRSLEFKDVVVDVPVAAIAADDASASPNASETDLYGALLEIANEEDALAYRAILDAEPRKSGSGHHCATRLLDEKYGPVLLTMLVDRQLSATGYRPGRNHRDQITIAHAATVLVRPRTGQILQLCGGDPLWSSVRIQFSEPTQLREQPDPSVLCVALFERLDSELSLQASKKVFYQQARSDIDPNFSDYDLLQAWKKAKLNPVRRKAGLKSQLR